MAENRDIGMKCIKYMIFITNFIFLMIGFLLISIGSTISTVYSDFELFMENHHFQAAYLMIAIGVLIFLVALFGCCGTIKQSVALINTYVLLLVLLLIIEVSTVIVAFGMRSTIYIRIEENMFDGLAEYPKDDYAKYSWNFMQERLHCCGVHQVSDWSKHNITDVDAIKIQQENVKFSIPRSCSSYFSSELVVFETGCLDRLYHIVNDGAIMVGVGGICVIVVQILLAVFAYMLGKVVRQIKNHEEMERQEARRKVFEQLMTKREEKPAPAPLRCDNTSSEA